MEEYMNLLFEEYKKTLDKTMLKNKKINNDFNRWLEENKYVLTYYENFIESVGFIPKRLTIELDKIKEDSVLMYLPINSKGIIVSKYAKSDEIINPNLLQTNGTITKENNNLYLNYGHNKKIEIKNVRNIITELPITETTKNTIIDSILCNKNVIVGTYGRLKDQNREDKIKELYELKSELEVYTGKNIVGEYSENYKYYVTCITPKILYNEKNHKTLWR